MNKLSAKIRFIGTLFVVVAMCIPSVKVQAGVESYTVTFRPGNVGSFALSAQAGENRQENANAVAKQQYAGIYGAENVTVTKNGAIKVTVPAGSAMPQVPSYIVAESGYFVKDASIWGPTTQNVDKNMDFVVDYGKLVNGVEYTVEYVDSSSGESIAPVYIAQANAGESRSVTAPKQIVISGGAVYNLSSAATLEKVLDSDSSKNVFTFTYTMQPSETVVEEVVTYIDGGTVTTTETVTKVIDNGTTVITNPAQAGGGNNTGRGGQGESEEDVNVEEVQQEEVQPEEIESEEVQPEEDINESENVTIEDESTPLAPVVPESEENESTDRNVVNIGEEEVPLADFAEEPGANMAVVGACVFVGVAAIVGILWIFIRKRNRTNY